MSKIPGFRSGKAWKKVIATIAYIFIALIITFIASNGGDTKTTTPTTAQDQSRKTESTTPQKLTIQDIASRNNLTVGELDKIYRLDKKNKFSDGSFMIINFQSVKLNNNLILVENVLPLNQTSEMINSAGFFAVYDESGKQFSDLSFKPITLNNGNTGIVISADKTDLSKCKYLSFGPVDGVNGQQILFPIQ